MTTYPFGYKPDAAGVQGRGTQLTGAELAVRTTWRRLDPEFRRRLWRMMEVAALDGVDLGCGTGWRVQPDPPPPGFAKPGNSWHESCPVELPDWNTAFACDMVPDLSWPWMTKNCARFGLRHFGDVNKEPWHVQPVEIPVSRSWRGAGRPATTTRQLPVYPLPVIPMPGDPPLVPLSADGLSVPIMEAS